ncbi:OmpH family outer membrane protein [Flavobacteriales bacterium]|nr:OmpH family outer membrane protein [Flavobacteriales bacterium]
MNQVSLLLNLALSIAVATLFYLHFAPEDGSNATANVEPVAATTHSDVIPGGAIAYVNSDTIWAKYNLILDLQAVLEDEQRKQESYLSNKGRKLEEDAMAFQQRASQMTEPQLILAQNELQQQQADLQNRQQDLLVEQQRIEQQLYDKQQEMGLQIRKALNAQLKEYSAKNGFQIIMAYNQISDLLYAPDSLEITNTVLANLNQKYASEKASTSAE